MDPILIAALQNRQRDQVRAFIGEHCVLGSNLVLPLRVLWRSYELHCTTLGRHADADPAVLRATLNEAPWAKVEQRGTGRLRTVVHGLGLRATAPIPKPGG